MGWASWACRAGRSACSPLDLAVYCDLLVSAPVSCNQANVVAASLAAFIIGAALAARFLAARFVGFIRE